MNIAVARPGARLSLLRDGRPLEWRALAKDGWALDSLHATTRPSVHAVGSGETADFEFTPQQPGERVLEVRALNGFLLVSGTMKAR